MYANMSIIPKCHQKYFYNCVNKILSVKYIVSSYSEIFPNELILIILSTI